MISKTIINILSFVNEFSTEDKCKLHLAKQREHEGIICKHCKGTKHYWLQAKWQWQSSNCNFRTTLRSGTIMQSAKLPVRAWYLAMAFMTLLKKGISAKELQRQLQHKRYDTIWSLMHRIRSAMGNRDALYRLEDFVELDEGYFSTATPDGVKLKRGRGSQRKRKVVVLEESVPLEDIETGKESKQCRYFKMRVLKDHGSDEINQTISEFFL